MAEQYARAQRRSAGAASRVRRHVDAVWQGEGAVRAAYEESRQAFEAYVDTVDYRLRMVEIEAELAEAMVVVELAEDTHVFAEAVDAELAAWQVYIERLQAQAAALPGTARRDAEEAVRELRRGRSALAQRLAEFRVAQADEWREASAPVRAASAELERTVDETSAKFD